MALVPALMLYAQTASKPESGFISPAKYTNAFFGFSLPLPQDAQLKLLVENAPKHTATRHILFAANSTNKGYPEIVVGVDEIIGSGEADAKSTVLSFGAQKADVIEIGGKEFSRGRWRADKIYRVAYVTRLNGYLLFISTFTFNQKVLDEFEESIQAFAFFDPAKALEFAGPDAQKYGGPDEPARPTSGLPDAGSHTETFASQRGADAKVSDLAAPKAGEFYAKDLDLHFNYPVEMRTLDARADMESGHQNVYGVSGNFDPEHQETLRCTRPLLDADLPEEKAPQRSADVGDIWVDDSQAYRDSRKPEPIFAKILLVEVVKDCLPQKLQKNENDTLGNIALTFVSVPGIQRMPQPIWYEVGKQKIHMNSGVGRPIVNGKLATAPIIVMATARPSGRVIC